MSRNTKIILAIAGGAVLLLSICACVTVLAATVFLRSSSVSVGPERMGVSIGEAVQVQPGQPETADNGIAGITLPAGWVSDFSLHVAGFRLVGYKPASGSGHIMLAMLPNSPGRSAEDFEQELRGLADTHGYRWNTTQMVVVERRGITVKGQATEMVISEGTGSSGAWRQAMVSFSGDQGLMLVIYGMPKALYDQGEVDAVFASIR